MLDKIIFDLKKNNKVPINKIDDEYFKIKEYELEQDYIDIINSNQKGLENNKCNSWILYGLGITNKKPEGNFSPNIKHVSARVSPADLDLDFQATKRDEVISYVQDKYGSVNGICTFSTINIKSAIKDICRVLDIPVAEADLIISKLKIYGDIEKLSITGKKEEQIEVLEEALKQDNVLIEIDQKFPKLFGFVKKLVGKIRQISVHPSAQVISTRQCDEDLMPLRRGTNENKDITITQGDMEAVEELGFLKLDFLGLKTLDAVSYCIDIVKQQRNEVVDLTDEYIYSDEIAKFFTADNLTGIFQMEGQGARFTLEKIKPQTFIEVAHINALCRPGASSHIDEYIRNRTDNWKTPYEDINNVLAVTNGIYTYQEQIVNIVKIMSGFSYSEADNLRRIIGKKKDIDGPVGIKVREKFFERSIQNGYPEEFVQDVWNKCVEHSGYSFNASHAYAYTCNAFQCMWLKINYPAEFLCSLINAYIDDRSSGKNKIDYVALYIDEARRQGVDILPIDINKSDYLFKIEDGRIRVGFAAINGIGSKSLNIFLQKRVDEIKSIIDFYDKCSSVGKGNALKLAYSGAFDEFVNRAQAISDITTLFDSKKNEKQISMFDEEETIDFKKQENFSTTELYNIEKEYIGFWITNHPLSKYERATRIADIDENTDFIIGIVLSHNVIKDKKGNLMSFTTLEDETGELRCVLFSNVYAKINNVDLVGKIVNVFGRKDGNSFIVNNIAVVNGKELKIHLSQFYAQAIVRLKDIITDNGKYRIILFINDGRNMKKVLLGESLDCDIDKLLELKKDGLINSYYED